MKGIHFGAGYDLESRITTNLFVICANSIVFYPGACVHEVTPVACEPDDFTAARLSVNVGSRPRAA